MNRRDQNNPADPVATSAAEPLKQAEQAGAQPEAAPSIPLQAATSSPVEPETTTTPDAAADTQAAPVSGELAENEPAHPALPSDPMKPVRVWLWILAFMVFAMVVVGGATRLTEAGLSITEWKPITGILPPLTDAAWQATFEKYKQIPQFKEMFSTMTMAQYKVIFFWEWGHRLLGRLVGLVFVVPFVIFLFMRRISQSLFWKLLGLLALGALQGLVGWWMVKSGLSNRVEVAAERLAIHLLLASITFVALIWLAMRLGKREPQQADFVIRFEASGLIVAVLIQIGLGALVAGSRAGLTYKTWPLMDGHLVPSIDKLTNLKPLWLNFLENTTTLQFQHRMFAYLVVLMVLGHAFKAMQNNAGGRIVRRAWAMSALVLVQAALGVFTLLQVLPAGKIPIYLGLAHQAVAFLLLAMAVVHRAAMSRTGTSAKLIAKSEQVEANYAVTRGPTDDTAIAT